MAINRDVSQRIMANNCIPKIFKVEVFLSRQRACDQHGLGSKPTRAILYYPWKDTLWYFPLLGDFGKQF